MKPPEVDSTSRHTHHDEGPLDVGSLEQLVHDLGDVIGTTICMEDAPAKPDPAGVRLALARLGVDRAWMIGDTPDDIRAARNAGVIPIGVIAPGDPAPSVTDSLFGAGAARVLENISQIEEFLR